MFDEVFQNQYRKSSKEDDDGKGEDAMKWILGFITSGFGIGKIFTAFKELSKLKKLKKLVKEVGEAVKEFRDIKPEVDQFAVRVEVIVKKIQKEGIDSVTKEQLVEAVQEAQDIVRELKEFAKEAQDVINVIKE